ncbi:hypothetical protein ACYOEI_00065 [Singulisphaera rosea]
MANNITGLFETLVAAATDAASALKYKSAMLDSVYTQLHPNYATIGSTLNVNVPKVDTSTVSNIGSGSISPSYTDHDTFPIVFDTKQSTSYVIKSFDQVRTPSDLREMFVDARLESLIRATNLDVVSLVTTGNFNGYTSITGGADVFTRTHLSESWANLAGAGVPVEDLENLFFITNHVPYSNMLNDTSFYQQSIVGDNAAESVQQRATILPQFNTQLKYDQQFPVTSGAYTALHFHRYAIAMRTGVEPSLANSVIKETIVYPKPNIPVKIQMWNDPDSQGVKVHMSLCYGKAIIRKTHGSILVST